MTELIITSLFQDPEVQSMCFAASLPMYLAIVVGNGVVVLMVNVSKRLHPPRTPSLAGEDQLLFYSHP